MRAFHVSLVVLVAAGCSDVTDKAIDDIVGTNAIPSIGSVTLTPDPGYEATLLSCNPAGIIDDDGDPITLTYTWRVNGADIATTGETLSGADFNKDDSVGCTVTPSDGTDTGIPVASNEVPILNTPPRGVSVAITPDPATPIDIFTAIPAGWSDDDGDDELWRYEWFVNGVAGGGGLDTFGPSYVKGDQVYVIVTPDDRTELGDPIQSQTVTIGNTPPRIDSATLTPSSPYVTDGLLCTPNGAVDDDGDFIVFSFDWFVNNNPAGSGTDQLFSPNFSRGDDVYCEITPSDGVIGGSTVTSNEVTILNSPPLLTSVTLVPDPAFENDVLTCIAAGMADVDNDVVYLTFTWTVGGLPSANTGTTITGTDFNRGDAVVCTVTPDDGTDTGDSLLSNIVVISNTPPALTVAQIAPSNAYTDDSLTASGIGWSDIDGDPPSYLYLWYVNGIALPAETSSTLLFIHHQKGDLVSVHITPDDGVDVGPTVQSADVLILNTPPEAPSITISPNPPDDPDDLTCGIVVGSFDADGDTVSYLYDWQVNGGPSGIVSNTVLAANTQNGDFWQCTVTPDDGEDLGPSAVAFVVVVDTSPPVAPLLDPLDEFRNDPLVPLSGTAEPLSVVTLYATCLMGSSGQTVTAADPIGFFVVNWNMVYGEYCDFYVTATDGALNESAPSNTVSTLVCGVPDVYEGGGYGDSPADPIDEWPDLPDDGIGAYVLAGNILAQDPGDWFLVRAADNPISDDIAGFNDFDFHVQITGGAEYTFIVYKNAVSPANQECVGFLQGYDDYNDYPVDQGDAPDHPQAAISNACGLFDPNLNECEDLGISYYIDVIRTPVGPLDCQNYEITITNGVP